jgi:hypothetical protein
MKCSSLLVTDLLPQLVQQLLLLVLPFPFPKVFFLHSLPISYLLIVILLCNLLLSNLLQLIPFISVLALTQCHLQQKIQILQQKILQR